VCPCIPDTYFKIMQIIALFSEPFDYSHAGTDYTRKCWYFSSMIRIFWIVFKILPDFVNDCCVSIYVLHRRVKSTRSPLRFWQNLVCLVLISITTFYLHTPHSFWFMTYFEYLMKNESVFSYKINHSSLMF